MKIYHIVIIICFIGLNACELDEFRNTPEIKNVVVNSIIESGMPVLVNVSEYQPYADSLPFVKYIGNAEINFYENNQFIGSLVPYTDQYNDKIIMYELQGFLPTSGNNYKIEVNTENSNIALSGNDTIPAPVQILNVDTVLINNKSYGNDYNINFKIRFKDPDNLTNIYSIRLYKDFGYERRYSELLGIDSDDPLVEGIIGDIVNTIYFSDKLIDGKEVNFSFWSNLGLNEYDDTYLFVELRSISREFYKFLKSTDLYEIAKEDYYAEPVQVYSNILNGKGAFLGFSSSIYTIRIKKRIFNQFPF